MIAAQTVLVVGATSGIGRVIAEKFATSTSPAFKEVVITGRRKDLVDEVAKTHANITGEVFDPNDLSAIPAFSKKMAEKGVTYTILNAGTMKGMDFSKPEALDMGQMQAELNVNYVSPVHFLKEFITLYNATKTPATVAVVTSGLALVPLPRCPGYSASKAALRAFIMATRSQLQAADEGTNFVSLVEILPPAVQTDLHDPKNQPDLAGKPAPPRTPLDEYTNDLFARIIAGEEVEIGYGFASNNLATVGKAQRAIMAHMPPK
ncbi:NAD(P)-binding protein [Pseudohyphozyma bogoriensis]|nr:NAD(P)-binding protein [Pseudohyphozyma bogoriensis]